MIPGFLKHQQLLGATTEAYEDEVEWDDKRGFL